MGRRRSDAQNRLRVHLFGQPRFELDGEPWSFVAPPKTLPLLGYLALRRAGPVSRESLAFNLWPDDEEEAARANLRRHTHYLLKALPPSSTPWLISDGDVLQWNRAAGAWLDVEAFERFGDRPDTYGDAVALYAGDLFESLYDDWILGERERLRGRYFAMLAELVGRCRSARDFAAGIAYAQRVLAHDPWREDALRSLVTLRYEAGDRAGALHEFERFAQRLRGELGVDPMPETLVLRDRIVRSEALAQPPSDDGVAPSSAPRRVDLPFVGRDGELERLRAAWSRAVRGRGAVMLIGGEAGVGKTRLASELALVVEAQGGRILTGGTGAPERMPYEAVVDALRGALPMLRAIDERRRGPWWNAVAPLLREAGAPAKPAPVDDVAAERARLFDGIAQCLRQLALARPTLLVLEDVHWATQATCNLLDSLVSQLAHAPILIVATFREEEAAAAHPLRALRRRLYDLHESSHVSLGRLKADAVRALLEKSGLGGDDERARRLYDLTDGNPLFVVELLREFADMPPDRTVLQPTIRATILARVDRLSEGARSILDVAAVIGTTFDVDVLRDVSGWSEDRVLDALGELLDHQLVRDSSARTRFDYAFSHQLVRSVVYDAVPSDVRKRRHARAGRVMERLTAGDRDTLAAEIAAHYDSAGEGERAAVFYALAARHSLRLFANDESLRLASQGLALASEPRTRFDLAAVLEATHDVLGDRAAQRNDLDVLERIAAEHSDDDLACDVLQRQIRFHRTVGERDIEVRLVAELTERSGRCVDLVWPAHAQAERAQSAIASGDFEAAEVDLRGALAAYSRSPQRNQEIAMMSDLANVLVLRGRIAEAQTFLDRAQELANRSGDLNLVARAMRAMTNAAVQRQDFAAGRAFAQQLLDVARSTGDRMREAEAEQKLGVCAGRLREYVRALAHYERARSLYEALGHGQGVAAVAVSAASPAIWLGRYATADVSLRNADRLFEQTRDVRGRTLVAINRALCAYLAGDPRAAQTAAAQGVQLARELPSPALEASALANLGAAEAMLGLHEAAIEHMEQGVAIRRGVEQPSDLIADLSYLADAYLSAGKLGRARAAADEILTIFREVADRCWQPHHALWVAARVREADGDVDEAARLRHEARIWFERTLEALPDPEARTALQALPQSEELVAG